MVYLYRPDSPDGALFAVHHQDLEGGQLLDSASRGRGVPASQGTRVTPSKLPAPAPEVAGVEEGRPPAPAQGDGVSPGLLKIPARHFDYSFTGHKGPFRLYSVTICSGKVLILSQIDHIGVSETMDSSIVTAK